MTTSQPTPRTQGPLSVGLRNSLKETHTAQPFASQRDILTQRLRFLSEKAALLSEGSSRQLLTGKTQGDGTCNRVTECLAHNKCP